MFQELIPDKGTLITRDNDGVVRDLNHAEDPVAPPADSAREVADLYLRQQASQLSTSQSSLRGLESVAAQTPEDEASGYRFSHEKTQFDLTTVGYQQTYFGLPVWGSGVTVQVKHEPYRVMTAQHTGDPGIDVNQPAEKAIDRMQNLTANELAALLGVANESVALNGKKLWVFQYNASQRTDNHTHTDKDGLAQGFTEMELTLPVPKVDKSIKDGKYYVALEVLFSTTVPNLGPVNWRAFIEVETGSVLHLRALIDNVNGLVFPTDPITLTGNPATGPTATNATLNALRQSVPLPLNPPLPIVNIQTLTGQYVRISDFEAPNVAAPTQSAGVNFDFNVRTNQFAAVSAYYNCDRFFRLMQGMGFNMASYFNNTTFPVPIDHRGRYGTTDGVEINAYCAGNASGNGIGRSAYMLANTADPANPITIAADWRVVLHEFGGHGILWDNVSSPNFGFAHSAGDSVAVVLNDPTSQAPDRFLSFPWVSIGRRHDRSLASGWGWGGTNDVGGYSSEQILSTTLFRLYQSLGGDSTSVARRQFAARYVCYLIFRAVGTLTPATNPGNAIGFASALMTADLGDWTTEGHSGGAYGKVIRWAFEKQALYRAPGTPATSVGAPPAVDVYVEDGRGGEYTFQPVHWNNTRVWNRRNPDGLMTHQEPVVGQPNYAYVKVKNRGTQTATNVRVKGFHCNPGTGLTWPNDWQPMTTAQLAAPNIAPNNGAEVVVGPFTWTPANLGHECMLMIASATGDPSNIDNFTAGDSIPEWRLVPNDNNIAQRNVAPISASLDEFVKAFRGRKFLIRNPFDEVGKLDIRVQQPKWLTKLGWQLVLQNQQELGRLDKRGKVEAVLTMKAGEKFDLDFVRKQRDRTITVEVWINDMPTGGMTYVIEPRLTENEKVV